LGQALPMILSVPASMREWTAGIPGFCVGVDGSLNLEAGQATD